VTALPTRTRPEGAPRVRAAVCPRRQRRWWVGLLVATFVVAGAPVFDAAAPTEAEVKAAYVFNFLKYVEWPARVFRDDKAPFVIGVVGDGPVRAAIDALQGRQVRGRTIEVRHVERAEATQAHALFVCGTADPAHTLKNVDRMPILSVTELDGSRPGSVINLVRIGDRIGFDVDLDAANAAGLEVSSRLLSVARSVQSSGRGSASPD
jgi:hypothetical protein